MSSSDELRLRRATREDIAFLANLQSEMNTQPHLCQADPRFWVIVDYRYRPAARMEDVDRVCIYSDDGSCEYLTTSELRKAAYEDAFKLGGEEYARDWLDEYNLYREDRDEDEFSIEEDYGADLEKVCEYVPEDFDSMYDGEDRRVIVGKPSEDCTSFVCSECANYMMFDWTGEYSWFEPEYPYKPIALNHCPRCGARVLFPPSWLDMKEVEE